MTSELPSGSCVLWAFVAPGVVQSPQHPLDAASAGILTPSRHVPVHWAWNGKFFTACVTTMQICIPQRRLCKCHLLSREGWSPACTKKATLKSVSWWERVLKLEIVWSAWLKKWVTKLLWQEQFRIEMSTLPGLPCKKYFFFQLKYYFSCNSPSFFPPNIFELLVFPMPPLTLFWSQFSVNKRCHRDAQ